jgi:hypothetical protein
MRMPSPKPRVAQAANGRAVDRAERARAAPHPAGTRRTVVIGAAALPWLGACTSLADMTRLSIGVDELAAMIQRQFPRRQRIHDALDVVLANPKLRLVPQRNRLATELDVGASERFFGREVKGSLGLEYGLRYESSDASVRLAQVQVRSLRLDEGAGRIGALLPLGQAVIEQLLDDLPVVKLSAQRAQALRQLSLTQAAITVTDRGLDIRFGPVKRRAHEAAARTGGAKRAERITLVRPT